jgi:hypothetical protein
MAWKQTTGFLVCDRCNLAVPYTGYDDPDRGNGWPRHRCTAERISTIEPFSRFSDIDPSRPPLEKGAGPGAAPVALSRRYRRA